MLIFLKGCGNYQLTFNNLNFSLTEEELIAFKEYLKQINRVLGKGIRTLHLQKENPYSHIAKQFHYSGEPL